MSLELSYEELDGYIQQISSGKKLVYVEGKGGNKVPLILRYPTPEDNLAAEIVYNQAIDEAKEAGLPTLKEMEEVIRARGIFTEEDEKKIESLRSKIEGQKAILAKTTRVPARRDRLKGIINDLQKQIDDISLKKESSLELSQERKANEEKFLFLTQRGTYCPFKEDRYWPTLESFQKEPNFVFRKRAFVEYVVLAHGMRQPIIRYIARSNLWRIRYVTSVKTGEALFNHPVSHYNVDQLTLLYWSHFYQSVYEMMPSDRPEDQIIEDDQALDAYMKDWQADRNREAAASKAKSGKSYGNKSAWDHGEQLVMRSNPMHSDIEYSQTLAEKAKHTGTKTVDAAPLGRNKRDKSPLTRKR